MPAPCGWNPPGLPSVLVLQPHFCPGVILPVLPVLGGRAREQLFLTTTTGVVVQEVWIHALRPMLGG